MKRVRNYCVQPSVVGKKGNYITKNIKGQERTSFLSWYNVCVFVNKTNMNLPGMKHGRSVITLIQLKKIIPLRTLHHNLIELGHFFAAIALQLLSYFAKYPVLSRI